MARWARVAWIALAGVVALAMLVLFVFPTQAYLSQRRDLNEVQAEVTALERENAKLDRAAERLRTPAEIERLARERFNMVRPGEQPLMVVPGSP